MKYSDRNGEKLAESMILMTFAQYKLNESLFAEGKLTTEEYTAAKSGILACTSALLYGSDISKNTMLQCGFLAVILTEFIETSESLLLEDVRMTPNTTTKAPTTKTVARTSVSQSKPTPPSSLLLHLSSALGESVLSKSNKTFKKSTLLNPRDAFLQLLKVLKYFFVEEAGIVDSSEDATGILMQKLNALGSQIFEAFNKGWRVAVRKEEYLQEFLFALTNFATNQQMNSLFFSKLVDNKLTFFTDLLNLAQKYV